MNRKFYEALYLRLQSKALEHYEIARQLLTESTTASECSHLLDELEKHINGCTLANASMQLLRDQFQEQMLGHEQTPSPTQRWDSLMEGLATIDQRLKPPAALPVGTNSDDNNDEE